MKAKRLTALAVCITMIFSLFSTVSFAAGKTYKVVDMSKKSAITNVGAKANSKQVKNSKYSAEWSMDEQRALFFKDINHDFSGYSEISFALKLDSTDDATILFSLYSENSATDGIDYYSKEITVKPGQWNEYTFKYSDLGSSRTPIGFNQIDSITLHGEGWNNTHAAGAKMYVDGFTLSGDPTDIKGTTPTASAKPAGTKTFSENDTEIGDKIFFNGKSAGISGLGNNKKKNLIEQRTDSDGDKYIYFETLDNSTDFHLDMNITEPTRYMVVQMKIAHNGSPLDGNIQYKDVNNKTSTVLTINSDKTLSLMKNPMGSLSNKRGEYTDVALAFDFAKNTVSGYLNGKKMLTDVPCAKAECDAIKLLRLYFSPTNEIGTALMIKDYTVYEGNELRDIPKDYTGPRNSKISLDNSAAIKVLGNDVVAISVGGNGIYYNGEKHDIDAPAFIKDDRTLVPVRAISEAFGLKVDWDEQSGTVTIDGKSKIVIGSNEMTLPDGSTYTLDVVADTYNDRTFLPLRALCEKILGKVVTWSDKGLIVIGAKEFTASDKDITTANNYLLYDRPLADKLIEMFNNENKNVHPRVLMNPERYRQIKDSYATDAEVQKWGANVILSADKYIKSELPTYSIPDGYRLLATSRDVYGRSMTLSMAYILTGDKKYADALYDVFHAAGTFPDWNPQHFLDVAEMTCAFAIGYDWLYDVWTDEQKKFLEQTIHDYGLTVVEKAYYDQLGSYSWWTPGNTTNWNVVCNGGTLMGAVAVFDKYPELCADLIQRQVRDVESMMNSFYPDGAWFEGIGYWSYTLDYTANMFNTLKACFNTDFNLSKAPGFANTIYFAMAGDGPCGINNFHDTGSSHMDTPIYFWLSNEFDLPGVTNVRLYNMEQYGTKGSAKDILYYNTSIKGTDFTLAKDTYLRDVEFVAMRNSWVDKDGAWLSYHAGKANVNHSHLDTGTFVVDLLGERWAIDIGSDDYNIDGYFGATKHKLYRLRPEGHNLYVINPDAYEGQNVNSFCNVESLVSKPRGAYSVADLSPAYDRDTTSARRGYMLADDRRSAVIRDEITLSKNNSEIYWFSHVSAGTEATVVDNKTIMLSRNGKKVKVMIDSDIPNYELSMTDAVPLPNSPVVAGQNANAGIKKITLHGKASGSIYIQAKFIPADDVNADLPFENVKIDEWTIPDGDFKPAPVAPKLTNIVSNGEKLLGFNSNTTMYTVSMPYGTEKPTTITAECEQDSEMSIEQAQTVNDQTIIKVWRPEEPMVVRKYVIVYVVLPKLEDINGYTRLQVASHIASEEPEAAHPASLVSDNDTAAESRWSAEGSQWITLDLGGVYDINAVGLSWWKGNTRTYKFSIEVSEDGENYTPVVSERTGSGQSNDIEIFDFDKTYKARYVRYSGKGNSDNSWNSITEFAALKK